MQNPSSFGHSGHYYAGDDAPAPGKKGSSIFASVNRELGTVLQKRYQRLKKEAGEVQRFLDEMNKVRESVGNRDPAQQTT